MTDLRKMSEAAERANSEFLDALKRPGSRWEKLRATKNKAEREYLSALEAAFRSGSLIPRSEYERVLALLAEAREALRIAKRAQAAIDDAHDQDAGTWGLGRLYEAEQIVHAAGNAASATLSRIDDALAAEREARG